MAAQRRTTTGIRKLADGRWQARAELPRGVDGKRRTKAQNFGSRGEAVAWRNKTLEAKRTRTLPLDDTVTVSQFAHRYAATAMHKSKTRNMWERVLRRLDGTPLGAAVVIDVNQMDIQEWINALTPAGHNPGGVRIFHAKIQAIFNAAVKNGLRPQGSPVQDIALPPLDDEEVIVLTAAQVQAVRAAMPEHQRAWVTVSAGLGTRISESLALRRQDIDFEQGTVRIDWQLQNRERVRPKRNPRSPKDRSRRTIRAQPHVLKELAAHMLRHTPLGEEGLIFYTSPMRGRGNRPYTDIIMRAAFMRAVAKCAAVDPTWPEGVTPHKLRHYFATTMIHHGFTVFEVAEWLGDSPEMVLKVYGHVQPDTGERVRSLLGNVSAEWTAAGASEAGGDSRGTGGGLRRV